MLKTENSFYFRTISNQMKIMNDKKQNQTFYLDKLKKKKLKIKGNFENKKFILQKVKMIS